jgi:hypothetical protein
VRLSPHGHGGRHSNRHRRQGSSKQRLRRRDAHDACDGGLRVLSRRWWRLCFPSEMDLLNSPVNSGQHAFCRHRGQHRCHLCHHFWRGSGPIVVGIHVCLLVCLWREPRGVALHILVTEVTAVMKTMIYSEALRLPTGPQLEDARFPGQSVRTERERCSGGARGMVRGQDGEDSGSFRCC